MKLGLIREWKQPADKRVALTPQLCAELRNRLPNVEIIVESSPERTFTDAEYKSVGVSVKKDMSECDILLGVKEVPIEKLIPNKKYLFFSHTIKAQPYNQKLLQAIIAKNIELIDYETLCWPNGNRILGFGKWAGVVGTYNAFLTWGKKMNLFELPPAYKVDDYEKSMNLLSEIDLGNARIAYTGNGRVSNGIREVLELMKIREVTPQEFVSGLVKAPYFVQLTNWDLYHRKDGSKWDDEHFYDNHKEYCCEFDNFLPYTDILINGMYWENDMAPLFNKEDTAKDSFSLKVIADITCDVEGSVPITMKDTDIYNPTFGWSKSSQEETEPYGENTIDVMAVTNLPTEMPKNASTEFGTSLLEHIIPLLINGDENQIIDKATITKDGKLNSHYAYLNDFVNS